MLFFKLEQRSSPCEAFTDAHLELALTFNHFTETLGTRHFACNHLEPEILPSNIDEDRLRIR